MKHQIPISIVLACSAAISVFAQGTILINPSVRNGSFEDGFLSPWTVQAGSTAVVQEPSFAAQGAWFAALSQTANSSVVRPSIFQRPPALSSDGRTFSLTFAGRNGVTAFEGMRVFLAALDNEQTVVFATNTFFTLPPSGWQAYQADFQVPSAWAGGQVSLGFQFENFNAVGGATYNGYLDNVVLQQIPEPSSTALTGLGILWVVAWVHCYRRRRKGGHENPQSSVDPSGSNGGR